MHASLFSLPGVKLMSEHVIKLHPHEDKRWKRVSSEHLRLGRVGANINFV